MSEDKWTMRGLDERDVKCIKSAEELRQYIEQVGFLPLFRNEIAGFSVEEHVSSNGWWTDNEARDPWCWRMQLAEKDSIAYGKFFHGKAGFVSREWFPYFAAARRDGYDFDARSDEGLAKPDDRRIMDVLSGRGCAETTYLKLKTGMKNRFEPAIVRLMEQTYVIIKEFTQRTNRLGQPYGWHIAVYTTPEEKWGYGYVSGAYSLGRERCAELIYQKLNRFYPDADFGVFFRL